MLTHRVASAVVLQARAGAALWRGQGGDKARGAEVERVRARRRRSANTTPFYLFYPDVAYNVQLKKELVGVF